MYTVIGGFDVTGVVQGQPGIPYDTIQFAQNINDPLPQCLFDIEDPQRIGAYTIGQEVIIWDENAPPINNGTTPTVPAHNFLANAHGMNDPTFWPTSGSLAGLITYPGFGITITFNNNANNGTAQVTQVVPLGYTKPGQSYMLSCYLKINTTPLSGANAFMQLDFLDANSSVIGGSAVSFSTSAVTSNVRERVSAVAPSNAVYMKVSMGGKTTSGTNSGTLNWATPQLEPMWFTSEGVSYPTPDCNFNQPNCAIMPDLTISRMCRVFAGYINDYEISYEGPTRIWHISCAGAGAVLENCLVTVGAYLPGNDANDFISFVIGTYFPNLISDFAANFSIPNTPLVPGVTFNGQYIDVSFRQVLNALTALSGFQYYLDWYYILHYNPFYYNVATFSLSDSPDTITSFAYYDYKLRIDGTQLKYSVKVVGSSSSNVALVTGQNPSINNQPAYVTPPFSALVTDSTLDAVAACQARGVAEITKYGGGRTIATLKTTQYAIPGTVIYFTSTFDSIFNVGLVVQKVVGKCLGAGVNEYAYELGAYNPNVLDQLRNLSKVMSMPSQTTTTTPAATDIAWNDTNIAYSEGGISFH